MIKGLNYYFFTSYRRKSIDNLLERYKNYYNGLVLDIGGQDRGKFKKPKESVKKWIYVDIKKENNPDMVLDVADMNIIENESIDVINAIELFEHVKSPEAALKESFRVLKKEGIMIISVPFIWPVHPDPCDFQRWTHQKWEKELIENGFKIIEFEKTGLFFSVFSDMIKIIVNSLPLFKYFLFIYPVIDSIKMLDDWDFIKTHVQFKDYVQGYFIIVEKSG